MAVGLAVMLAVAFLSTTLMVNASTSASLGASLGEAYKNADLVVVPNGDDLDQSVLDAVAGTAGVGSTYGSQRIPAAFTAKGEEVVGLVRNLAPEGLESAVLTEGTYPGSPSDIAIDATTAQRLGIKTGDTMALRAMDGPTTVSLRVTGLLRPSADPFSAALPQLLALSPTVGTLAAGETTLDSIQLTALPGTNADQLKESLTSIAAIGQSGATVRTADEQVTYQVASMTGGQDQLTGILLAFAAVALVVSGLVVSNTFAVLVAQRTRELALLRCLGAARNQVRNSVLAEALVVGFAASVLGVLAGTGLMAGLVSWAAAQPDRQFATLAVPPSAIIVGLLAGVLLTVAAAYVPARAATAVAPLAALRPADDASLANTKGKLRLVLGLVALVVGVPLLVIGAVQGQLVIGFGGGLLSFLGVLMCSTLFIPRLVSLVGKLAAPAGVPGRLAALNSVRNPGRTSVTAAALLIGVTLVTLMMTGAASSRTAFDQMLAKNYPVDLAVSLPTTAASEGAEPAAPALTVAQRDVVRAISGVSEAELLPIVGRLDVDGASTPVYAIPAASAATLLRDQSLAVEPGKIYLPEDSAARPATVKGGTATLDLDAVVLEARGLPPFISMETAQPLLAGTATGAGDALWISLGESDKKLSGDDVREIQSSVAQALGMPESAVNGAALERVTFNEIIDVLLLVVTALLAVAVVIALIGVANTLSLSVLERTRENSLLRALGLTRGQLRTMLALEAVLVAGVAALIGAALGSMYGWLGAMSALGSVATVAPSIPWLQLLAVLGVAVVAGLLASVVPARRAARLSPVEGLATA